MLTLVRQGMGGSERYAAALTRELCDDPRVDATAVVPRAAEGFSQGIAEEVVARVSGSDGTRSRLTTLVQAQLMRRTIDDITMPDVVHFPFSVPVPSPPSGTPVVQTLHDVQHRDLPHLFTKQELLYRRLTYDRGARQADAVITVSEFGRDRAVATLGLDPAKVHVAHLGVDPVEPSDVESAREDFVIYPARGWPHKNHVLLIQAMAILRRRRPSLRLVLTGGGLATLGRTPDWVERRGHVPEDELDSLYRRASCLAFPSLYEGFGLPPLEAMARGCPTAVARAGALPEVCGAAAVLFDPTDPHAIAEGIDRAIADRPRLAAAGLERVRGFTWRRCAEVHVGVYRRVQQHAPGRSDRQPDRRPHRHGG
jgi:glycosyltransferase involved in cell wall biosynthesis